MPDLDHLKKEKLQLRVVHKKEIDVYLEKLDKLKSELNTATMFVEDAAARLIRSEGKVRGLRYTIKQDQAEAKYLRATFIKYQM